VRSLLMSCVMFMPVSFNKEASEASLVVCLFHPLQ